MYISKGLLLRVRRAGFSLAALSRRGQSHSWSESGSAGRGGRVTGEGRECVLRRWLRSIVAPHLMGSDTGQDRVEAADRDGLW